MERGIIASPAAWVYGADKKSVVDEVFLGWAVEILSESGDWIEIVTHYGYYGCMKKAGILPCGRDFLRKRDESGRTVVMTGAFTDVRKEPKVTGEILCTLHRGSFLTAAAETQNGYQKVYLADGKEGYVPCVSCRGRRDDDGYLYTDARRDYFLRQGAGDAEKKMREGLVSCAKSYLGTQYRWAGKSAEGIDCSGLTFMCYLLNGKLIYRDAKLQDGYPIHEIPFSRIKPGDLLYFPRHIALYLGDGAYLHATGNARSFACVKNSLFPQDVDYREDLAKSLLAVGSIW